jgi:hypothetical protein
VLRARRMAPEQRLLEGLRHSDATIAVMAGIIRSEHPDADEEQVLKLLKARIVRVRQLEALR